jgi:hypothetical protein
MADPLSILVNAVSVVDVCIRIGTYLKDIASDAATVDNYILDLANEVDGLRIVITSVQATFRAQIEAVPSPEGKNLETHSDDDLWSRVGKTVTSCLEGVCTCETVVKAIYGSRNSNLPSALDKLAKAHRKRSTADTFRQCREQLATYQRSLQVLLTAIDL